MRLRWHSLALPLLSGIALVSPPARAQEAGPSLDARVKAFLEQNQSSWHDMNVPARDGQFLHDLIVEHGYTRALEIGTSTGHSGIWIAWALSKTGGKLVTIEIDSRRHRRALENFERAGVADYVDARLADAHELVKTIAGPFDFVFSDADKGWSRRYFEDLAPKMEPGGCYLTHNAGMRSMRDYLASLERRTDFATRIEDELTTGIAVTCRPPG